MIISRQGKMLILAMAACWISTLNATAQPANLVRQSQGYVYFNQSGSSFSAMTNEVGTCLADISLASSKARVFGGTGILSATIANSASFAMRNGMDMVNLENCMVVRGWRVVRVTDDEGAHLSKISPDDLAARLAEWTGLSQPHGTVVRAWENDLTKPDTIRSAFPDMTARPSLSLLALLNSKQPVTKEQPQQTPPWPFSMNIFRTATTEQLLHVPDGWAVLVVGLRNNSPKDFVRLKLVRLGLNERDPASFSDHRPDTLLFGLTKSVPGVPAGSPISETDAFIIPAGRWALYGVSDVMIACLGTPFFDIAPGEVVYSGGIDFGIDGWPKDDSLQPARDKLQSTPQLRDHLRLAEWINGAKTTCVAGYTYALEFPSAPYAKGYTRAGMQH